MGTNHLENFFQAHATNLGPWALVVVFLGVFSQTFNPLGALIPGTPMLFLFGFMGHTVPGLSFTTVLMAMVAGGFFGSLFAYGTGLLLGKRTFRSDKFKASETKLKALFERFGNASVFVAYFLPFVRNVMPLFAGVVRSPAAPFVTLSFLGAFSWSVIVGGCGYFFGGIPIVKNHLDEAVLLGGLVMVLGLVVRIWAARRNSRKGDLTGLLDVTPH